MRIFFLLFYFVTTSVSIAQESLINFSEDDLKFLRYLQKTKQYHQFETYFRYVDPEDQSFTVRNELLYLKAGNAYYQKNLQLAADLFLDVNRGFSRYEESRFFAAYCLSHSNKVKESEQLLEDLIIEDPIIKELKDFQQAGNALLSRDLNKFRGLSKNFTYQHYALMGEEEKLIDYYQELKDFKPKSMVLAGLMSAVIPGSGKIYTGKVGEGIAALLTIGVLGTITAENYIKAGLGNYKTIFFGSIFSVFYLGNIYGSMVSVKVYRQEFNETIDQGILFSMHIPIRNVFLK